MIPSLTPCLSLLLVLLAASEAAPEHLQHQNPIAPSQPAFDPCQAAFPNADTHPDPRVKGSTLVHVQLFIRHGDRTPLGIFPQDAAMTWDCDALSTYAYSADKDQEQPRPAILTRQVVDLPPFSPFSDALWGGTCIPGQLTPNGWYQHQHLGRVLRKIYVDRLEYLPSGWDPRVIAVRSTDVWRTKQSAESLLTGMYETSMDNSMGIIPIYTLPTSIDYLTMNEAQCPRLARQKALIQKRSTVFPKLKKWNAALAKDLEQKVGRRAEVWAYMDTILPRMCHGKPMQCRPGTQECVTKDMTDQVLAYVANHTAETYRDGPGVQDWLRLGMSPLIKDIQHYLSLAITNQDQPRFRLFSGHDTTLAPLLGVLDAADMRWPVYASNILFEIWRTPDGQHFVRVFYNEGVLETKSGWCDLEWCPFDTFKAHLGKFTVEDLIQSCQVQEEVTV